MVTKTQVQPKAAGVFNAKAEGQKPGSLQRITRELKRILFLNRIAQTEISAMGKCDLLTDDLRKSLHATADASRQLDMKVRCKLPAAEAEWLTRELNKEKLWDIGNLVELASQVSNEGTDTDYEDVMYSITSFLERTLQLQARNKTLNLKKYKALIRFFTEEMTAEAEGGITGVEYNESTDSLSFKLVQPEAHLPAKPTI